MQEEEEEELGRERLVSVSARASFGVLKQTHSGINRRTDGGRSESGVG